MDPRVSLYFDVALIGATLLALVLLLVLRAWRPRGVVGPLRVEPGQRLWPLLVVSLVGVSVWLGTQMAYGFWKVVQLARQHGPDRPPQMSDFGPGDFAVLATVPGVAAFACLLAGDRLAGRWTAAWLGFGGRALLRGAALGLLGVLIVLPLVQWAAVGLEALYNWLRYEHPQEHDLLRVIVQAPSPWAKWLLIAGAVVVAPFFEEYLFRGHLQTLLREAMLRRSGYSNPAPPDQLPTPPVPPPVPPRLPPPLPVEHAFPYGYQPPPGGGVPVGYADGGAFFPPVARSPSSPPPDPRPLPETPAVWPAVVAILVTSLCFAVVHPMWTWPLIFVLSCLLGYAYERTGNLWTCITIHMAFNALSTIVYLNVFH